MLFLLHWTEHLKGLFTCRWVMWFMIFKKSRMRALSTREIILLLFFWLTWITKEEIMRFWLCAASMAVELIFFNDSWGSWHILPWLKDSWINSENTRTNVILCEPHSLKSNFNRTLTVRLVYAFLFQINSCEKRERGLIKSDFLWKWPSIYSIFHLMLMDKVSKLFHIVCLLSYLRGATPEESIHLHAHLSVKIMSISCRELLDFVCWAVYYS